VITQRYLYLCLYGGHRRQTSTISFQCPCYLIYVSSKSTHQLYPGDTTELLTDLLVSPSAFFRYLYSTEQRPDICTIQCTSPTIFRPHNFSQLQEAISAQFNARVQQISDQIIFHSRKKRPWRKVHFRLIIFIFSNSTGDETGLLLSEA
jgi:hypothetical protein